MQNIIMNGDIYIKLNPDYKPEIKFSASTHDAKIYEANLTTGKAEEVNLETVPESVIEKLEKLGLVTRETITIYNNSGFYQIFFNDNSFRMVNRETKEVLEYKTMEEISQHFINLYDFINKGISCGRYFASTDTSKPEYELIFIYQQYYLLRNRATGEYTVKDKHQKELDGYEFLGFLPNYIDTHTLYKEIVRSILYPRENDDQLTK